MFHFDAFLQWIFYKKIVHFIKTDVLSDVKLSYNETTPGDKRFLRCKKYEMGISARLPDKEGFLHPSMIVLT